MEKKIFSELSSPTPVTSAQSQANHTTLSKVPVSEPVTATPTVTTLPTTPQKESSANTVAAKHNQQQSIHENEQFAYAWIKSTIETTPSLSNRIEQQELYKMYITASQKIGRRGILSPIHFPRCVRSVFGGTVGPNQIKVDKDGVELVQFQYEGIRVKANPQPVIQKPAATSVSI